MTNSSRLRTIARRASLTLLALFILGWLSLYFDSLHERRRAEHLISDLKSFPFPTAGFVEVRDFSNRFGGKPSERFPSLQYPQYPPPAPPTIDSQGKVHAALTEAVCTPRDCSFEVTVEPRILKLFRAPAPDWLWPALAFSGVRAWVLYEHFEVRESKLTRSNLQVGQLRYVRYQDYKRFMALDYHVRTGASPLYGFQRSEYSVGVPHITGPPMDIMMARIVQTPSAPMRRALDIDLRCLTAVFPACDGFRELAPSAWADF